MLSLLLLATMQDPFLPNTPAFERHGESAYQRVGLRAVNAGDVNGDGRDDLLILTPGVVLTGPSPIAGRVEIFLGRASGYAPRADWTISGGPGDAIDWDAAGVGDLNHDGFDDVAVTSTGGGSYPNQGAVNVFYGSASGLTGSAGTATVTATANAMWRAVGNPLNSQLFGHSLLGPGDLTGNGFDDLLVGCLFYGANGHAREGAVFLFEGSATGLSGGTTASFANAYWSAESNRAFGGFGHALHAIGDVNGDQRPDFAVTGYAGPQDATLLNRHWVFTDVTGGLNRDANTASWAQFSGNGVPMGKDLAAADFNLDGYSDVVIAFPQALFNGLREPMQLWFGGPNGFSLANWVFQSEPWFELAGFSLSAGDLDVDGRPDLVVLSTLGQGRIRVFRGIDDPIAPIDMVPAWNVPLAAPGALAGTVSVEVIGDPELDGSLAVAVGESQATVQAKVAAGRVRVFSRNGDPPDACPFALPDWTLDDPGWKDQHALLADVNGDGFDDAVVCASSVPHVRIFLGSSTGLSQSVWRTINLVDPHVGNGVLPVAAGNVDGLPGDEVLLLRQGSTYRPDQGLGSYIPPKAWLLHGDANSVAISWSAQQSTTDPINFAATGTIADLDGDQRSDVVIGAYGHERESWPGTSDPFNLAGAVYVFLGSRIGPSNTWSGDETNSDWSASDLDPSGYFGRVMRSAGDLDNDGDEELLVGAHHTRNATGAVAGAIYLWQGSANLAQLATGTPASADWSATGTWPGNRIRLEDAGIDVTGDGIPDLVTASHWFAPQTGSHELIQVWKGLPTGYAQAPITMNERIGVKDNWFGSVRLIPDMSGDGTGELCVQRHLETVRYPVGGEVGVIFGGANLFDSRNQLAKDAPPPWHWRAAGEKSRVRLGIDRFVTRQGGDANGDGKHDLLLASKWYLNLESEQRWRFACYHGTGDPLLELSATNVTRGQAFGVGHLGGEVSSSTALVVIAYQGIPLPLGAIVLGSGMTDFSRCWHTEITVPLLAPAGAYELVTMQLTSPIPTVSQVVQLIVN